MQAKLQAFRYAIQGLKTFFTETFHARVHALLALAVVLAGLFFGLRKAEWLAIVICFALVFMAEAINSALEYTVDLAQSEQHPLAKKAKDVAAGAVLLAAIFASIIGIIIFTPKICALWP